MSLQRVGSASAWAMALLYVLGFAVLATVLSPQAGEAGDAAARLAFMLENKLAFQLWLIGLYVVFGLLLVVLQVSLQQRLIGVSPALLQCAGALGLIWAGLVIAAGMLGSVSLDVVAEVHATDPVQALTIWTALSTVQDGLGGGVEVVGGVWMLVLAAAIWPGRQLPRVLAWIALPVGVCGAATILPPLKELGAVFGLGQILWFAWLGFAMARRPTD